MTEQEFYKQLAGRYSHGNYAYPSTRYNKGKDITTMCFKDITVNVGDKTYYPVTGEMTTGPDAYTNIELSVRVGSMYEVPANPKLSITNVIFNPPATIVFWSDHTKTVVKCDTSLETYDPEKGLAMAISRKMLGDNKREYYNTFIHWLKRWNKQNETAEDIKIDIPKSPFSELADGIKKAFTKPAAEYISYMDSFQP